MHDSCISTGLKGGAVARMTSPRHQHLKARGAASKAKLLDLGVLKMDKSTHRVA